MVINKRAISAPKTVVNLTKEGYDKIVFSRGVSYLYKSSENRGNSLKLSHACHKRLKDMGILILDEELNDKESPLEDYHDIHYKFVTKPVVRKIKMSTVITDKMMYD